MWMKSLARHLCVKIKLCNKIARESNSESSNVINVLKMLDTSEETSFSWHTYLPVWCNVIATMKQFRKSYEPVFEFHDTIFHSYRIFSNNSYASLIIQRRSWETDWLFHAIKFFLFFSFFNVNKIYPYK